MAGYGGQLVALNTETPADAQAQWAQVRSSQLANDFAAQDNPLRIASQQMQNQQSQLGLEEAQNQQPIRQRQDAAATQAQYEAQIAHALSLIDPNANDASSQVDDAMKRLDASGNPLAKQHIGKVFNSAKKDQLLAAYMASASGSPLAAAGAMAAGGVSGLAGMGAANPGGETQSGGGGMPAATPEQLEQTYGQMTDEEIAQHARQLGPTLQAAQSVLDSHTPMATFNQAAQQLGTPQLQAQSDKDAIEKAQWILQHDKPVGAYFQQRMSNAAAGLPRPRPSEEMVKVGDTPYAISRDASGKLIMRPLVPRIEKLAPGEQIVQIDPNAVGGASVQSQPTATPVPRGAVYDQIGTVASHAGGTPAEVSFLQREAQIESSGDLNAQAGKSTGLFQFHPDTFARLGGTDISDPNQQTQAALLLARQNAKTLAKLGVAPTDANLYIMHQQGMGGGQALLTAPPGEGAVAALTPVYGNAATARRAIVGNGGSANMTAQQFTDMWRQKWAGGSAAPGAEGQTSTGVPGVHVLATGATKVDDDKPLTDDAVDYVAQQYVATGQLPALGMGRAAAENRDAIINRAAEIEKETGANGADAVSRHLAVKAAGAALTTNTKQQAVMQAAADAASRNADLVLSLAPKGGGPTGIPVLNRWVQAVRKDGTGDPDVTSFDSALGGFSEQFARVQTGATGSQAATDSARKAAYDRLSKYATQGQLQAGIATMRREMANDMAARAATISNLNATIKNGGVPQASAQAGPTPPVPINGHTQAQMTALMQFKGSAAPGGSRQNPYVPNNEAQYKNLPSGAVYIAPSGQIMTKP